MIYSRPLEKPPGLSAGDGYSCNCKTRTVGSQKTVTWRWSIKHRNGTETKLQRVDNNGIKGKLIILQKGRGYQSAQQSKSPNMPKIVTKLPIHSMSKFERMQKLKKLEIGLSIGDIRREFAACDLDGDRQLSRRELFALFVRAGASRQTAEEFTENYFRLADHDDNGFIDFTEMLEEYERMRIFKITLWIRENQGLIDSNADGLFSIQEITSALASQVGIIDAHRLTKTLMEKVDRNNDNKLSLQEVSTWYLDLAKKAKERRQKNQKQRKQQYARKEYVKYKRHRAIVDHLSSQNFDKKQQSLDHSQPRNLKSAMRMGRKTGKPLFVHIGRTNCGNCVAMKRLYLTVPRLSQCVMLDVNVDHDNWWAKAYKPSGHLLPFIVIADPSTNDPLAQIYGFNGKSKIEDLVTLGVSIYNKLHEDRKQKLQEERMKSLKLIPQKFELENIVKINLESHNKYRKSHNVPLLQFSKECYLTAEAWAKRLAAEGKMCHGGHKGMGQNLAWSSGDLSMAQAVEMWYNEISKYDFEDPKYTSGTGHFTQVVWRGSTHVGMAVAKGRHGTYIVANYSPPGNYMGKFGSNVNPPVSKPSARLLSPETKHSRRMAVGVSKSIRPLMAFGFTKQLANDALMACNGDLAQSVSWCLRKLNPNADKWKRLYDSRAGKDYFFNVDNGHWSYGAPGTKLFKKENIDPNKSLQKYYMHSGKLVKAQNMARSLLAKKRTFERKFAMSHRPVSFEKIDSYVLNCPNSARKTLQSLADFLISGPSVRNSEANKARAIFRWITENIAFDAMAYFAHRIPDSKPKTVLRSGIAVCQGYSNLFKALADIMRLECKVIKGWAKGYNHSNGKGLNSKKTNHTWVWVRSDKGKPGLIDATWSAGSIYKKRFVKSFNGHYFLCPPRAMIYDHLPEHDHDQLLDKPVSFQEFLHMPNIKPGFWKAGLSLILPKAGTIKVATGETVIKIAGEGAEMKAYLASLETGRRVHNQCLVQQEKQGVFSIYIRFPKEGTWEVQIYAKAVDQPGSFPYAIPFVIHAENKTSLPKFPQQKSAKPGERIISPLTNELKLGARVMFSFLSRLAVKAAVMYHDEWFYLRKDSKGVWTGFVNLIQGPGPVKVVVKYPKGGKSFWTLVEYQCVPDQESDSKKRTPRR
ncbi:hypothetical protein AAMO2058_001123900 [Amorphochlora amoebiformis]